MTKINTIKVGSAKKKLIWVGSRVRWQTRGFLKIIYSWESCEEDIHERFVREHFQSIRNIFSLL